MIKFSAQNNAACTVETGKLSFAVFPQDAKGDGRKLMSSPIEKFNENIISWPGEYDFEGVFIRGIGQEDGKQISYSGNIEGVQCAFVNAPVFEWSDSDIEKLGSVDVLVIAADDEKRVHALVETVDPRMVLIFPGKEDIQKIVKACGSTNGDTESSVKVQLSSLPVDSRKVIVLQS